MNLQLFSRVLQRASISRVAAFALLAAIAASPAFAQDPVVAQETAVEAEAESQAALRDSVMVAMIATDGEAATFVQALAAALVRNFDAAGFRSVELFAGATEDASTDLKVARGVSKSVRPCRIILKVESLPTRPRQLRGCP